MLIYYTYNYKYILADGYKNIWNNCFISTVKKQGKNVMDYLSLALRPSNVTKNILLIE